MSSIKKYLKKLQLSFKRHHVFIFNMFWFYLSLFLVIILCKETLEKDFISVLIVVLICIFLVVLKIIEFIIKDKLSEEREIDFTIPKERLTYKNINTGEVIVKKENYQLLILIYSEIEDYLERQGKL